MKKFCFTLIACFAQFCLTAQVKLEKLWETDSTLKVPESVCFDTKRQIMYVTNIDGTEPWGKDGKGSIGKVATDGKIIVAEWVQGLNAPKGMAIVGSNLFVADLSEVVIIDLEQGTIVKKIKIDSAVGLNDVCVDKKGIVYVTDMKTKKLHRIDKAHQVTTLLTGLKNPNGVLKTKKYFFLLDAGTLYKIDKNNNLTKIVDGLEGGTDGIEQVSNNEYIVTCWAGAVYHVNVKEKTKLLILDSRPEKISSADLGINKKENIIYIPTFFRNTVVAYKVN